MYFAAPSSDDAHDANAGIPATATNDPLSLFGLRRMHVFYFVRVSLLLLKLYLDSRMLGFFVRSMHASSSLMASTYNQCAAIILAVSWSTTTEQPQLSARLLPLLCLVLTGIFCCSFSCAVVCSLFIVSGGVRCESVLRIPFVELARRRRTHSHWRVLRAVGTQRR
jgi:hypothetical protein